MFLNISSKFILSGQDLNELSLNTTFKGFNLAISFINSSSTSWSKQATREFSATKWTSFPLILLVLIGKDSS